MLIARARRLSTSAAERSQTDAIGYAGVRDRAHVHDVQATMLHLLGFGHERFSYPFQGQDYRLTDVAGRVIDRVVG